MPMKFARAFILFAAAMVLAVAAAAQEGYPLAGTWYGEFATGNQKNDLTVIMKWDGRSVTGLINPGPDSRPHHVRCHDHHTRKGGGRGTAVESKAFRRSSTCASKSTGAPSKDPPEPGGRQPQAHRDVDARRRDFQLRRL